MWLIDLKWWKKWEKSLEKNSEKDKNDSKNEVILSLKNLGKDNSDKSNGEIEKMDNSSLFKSVSSTHKFVFDERGHIPKTELGFGNCKPVSEYTFDYLKSKYGPCLSKFKFRVVLSRIRLFPTMILKMKLFGCGRPFTYI